MNKPLITQLIQAAQGAQTTLRGLNAHQKAQLEESWDVEHAYYSSVLEGSKLDKAEFEALARKTK